MGLEEILILCGAKKPFCENGMLSSEGEEAYHTLIKIVEGLHDIGADGLIGDDLENYLDEIIRLGF